MSNVSGECPGCFDLVGAQLAVRPSAAHVVDDRYILLDQKPRS